MHPTRKAFARQTAAFIAALILSGCGTVDQQAFDTEMKSSIHDGMPASDAIRNLQDHGLVCDISRAAASKADCSKTEQHLLMSCIMRVTFTVELVSKTVQDLNIAKIACAGL